MVLYSRISIIAFAVIVSYLIPDHQAEGVEEFVVHYSSTWMNLLLSPFVRWDSVHYLRIASEGYVSENQLAFSPLYPAIIRYGGIVLERILLIRLTRHETIIIAALIINFCAMYISYFALGRIFRQLKLSRGISNLALLFYCFNPAGVFFTTVYTESVFAALSWTALSNYSNDQFVSSGFLFLFASLLRSNGGFNVIVVLATLLAIVMRKLLLKTLTLKVLAQHLFTAGIICAAIILPSSYLNVIHMEWLCGSPNLSETPSISSRLAQILMKQTQRTQGKLITDASTDMFCSANALSSRWWPGHAYSYIQSKYWNVGLFRYYEWKQIPNFILAVPICFIAGYTIWNYELIFNSSIEKEETTRVDSIRFAKYALDKGKLHTFREYFLQKLNNDSAVVPFVLHLIALVLVGMCVANAQITTRLICASSPIIYVGMAHIYSHPGGSWVWTYVILYIIVGTSLHCNYYPWT